ncbi:hypothetical protein [Streptomyces sp. NPDC088746]
MREGHDDTYTRLRVRLVASDDVAELTAILADSADHPELGLPPGQG